MPAAQAPAGPLGIRAVPCDMDGTLVDTESAWLEVVAEILRPPAVAEFAGLSVGDAARLASRLGLTADPADLTARLGAAFEWAVTTGPITPMPGALDFLDHVAALGLPIALVTASERPVADAVLARLGAHRFACSVAGLEAGATKPAPAPYRYAARILGVEPGVCLAVEDTPVGVASATAAGCRVLAVPTLPGSIRPVPGLTVAPTLAGIDLLHLPIALHHHTKEYT